MKRLTWIAAASAALVLIVVIGSGLLGGQTASAQGDVDFDIDPDNTGNTASTIGNGVQECYRVDGSGGFDDVVDFSIDVVVQGDTQPPIAYDAWVIYEPTKVNPKSWNDTIKLPGAIAMTSHVPPQLNAGALYLGGGPGTAGDGTILRIDLDIDFTTPTIASFSFAKGAYKSTVSTPANHPGSTDSGLLAINQPCPKYADVEITNQVVKAANCIDDPPAEIDAGVDTDLCLVKTIVNNGPETPVDVSIFTDIDAPPDCTAIPDPYETTETGLTSTPVDVEEVFTVNCTEPSLHSFSFEDEVTITTANVEDTDPANNFMQTWYDAGVLVEADPRVDDVWVTSPANAGRGAPFDVTVSADLANTGYGPVNVDVTLDLDLGAAADCTRSPDAPQVVQDVSLGSSTESATWSVTCSTTGLKEFNGIAIVAVDQVHVTDFSPENDYLETPPGEDTTDVTAGADVRVVSWAVAEDDLPNAGYQVLIVPGNPETITTQQIMQNDGPDGPAATDDDRSVADDVGVCDVTPNDRTDSYSLAVGTPVGLNETWSVAWIDVDKPPYSCTLTFLKSLTLTEPGFTDPDPMNNDDSVDVTVVLDSDGDGVPDDGDLSGSDVDNPCAPGESTFCDDNCEDDINPGQEDLDDDGIGDACDADSDNDGICDPGKSAAYCTGSDNCLLIANPGQEDADTDDIGNVCELDVDCSGGGPDGADALMILQYILGRVDLDPAQCPAPMGFINGPRASAYVAYPGGGTGMDALMVLQCILGRHNIVCPAVTD